MSTNDLLKAFFDRQKELLEKERKAEVDRNALLVSACSPKLLESRGLALTGLGVVEISIGLGGKSLIELERPSAYHSTPLFPPHTFRPGDLARIDDYASLQSSRGKKSSIKAAKRADSDISAMEGVVYKVTDTRIVIAVDPVDGRDDLDIPEKCILLKLANSITFDRMDSAISSLEATILHTNTDEKARARPPIRRTTLVDVLLGISTPSPPKTLESFTFYDQSLNDSQREAVRFCLEASEVALIHGPPGTGKTHTLVEVIRHLIRQDNRVLVCGASNLAVDNLLERLIPYDIHLTRIGHPARVLASLHNSTLDSQASKSEESALANDVKAEIEDAMKILAGKGKNRPRGAERKKLWEEIRELRKEYRKREGNIVKRALGKAQIVFATCHSSGGRQLQHARFDVVIIDEATQALEAVCWIPILKGQKLILAGDPLQLPPTIMSMTSSNASPKVKTTSTSKAKAVAKHTESARSMALRPSESLEVTLFDRLEAMLGPSVKRMLTVQYRMHSIIAEFPSITLYSSKLISHESVASHLLKDLPGVSDDENLNADVLDVPIVFYDTSGCEFYERVEDEGGKGNDEGSRSNENEAVIIQRWVEMLVKAGVSSSQIAVITPYQAQVTLLTSMLSNTMHELEIGTVDGMQGREKEAVVLSLVRSNDKREVGFLSEKRRLNVAMTRPRRHLCVVGDSSTVAQGSDYLKHWMEWLETNADVRFGGELIS
ncbi:P-loop containing nucleoside triphosphate hydrolase protein [Cantharellus anzutake]|uniref:P-loop containing nucleoside triphosphate hydrolase protein n=1 Tax=Cantharellus anzutake TaxID=1750568 RepID=UPI001907F6CF|nr:P-loop containing nucleoside triphosphate hydrolase protein [Cantharellus anzutake]KAF8336585.1 P-loop containing nucleoside triphosphate hydrolase protein [Cantharellus anzutake]